MKVSFLLIILGFSQVFGWEVKCAVDSLDIVSCSNSEDCKECSDCNTVENGAFCDNGVCKCIFTVLYPSHDENNLDYINAKPEQIQSENDGPFRKECVLKEFLETRCSDDQDCQGCLNTPNGFCKDFKCDYKTRWQLFFPIRKLPKFERE